MAFRDLLIIRRFEARGELSAYRPRSPGARAAGKSPIGGEGPEGRRSSSRTSGERRAGCAMNLSAR